MQINRTLLRNTGLAIVALGLLAACDDNDDVTGGDAASRGVQSIGSDFVRAFSQSPGDAPLSLETVTLVQTPNIEPFNP